MAENERAAWRQYFEMLAQDERRGLDVSPDERRSLLAMCRTGFVVWRCRHGAIALSYSALNPHP